jgi:processive 1,2-diacylglycerol beta-glucosyltransferase
MKILVIHASAGAGHFKAAEAIYRGFKNSPQHTTLLVDALDYTSLFFKRSYRDMYFFLISKIPGVWKFFFGLMDIPRFQPVVRGLRRLYNAVNAPALHRFLIQEDFDYIVATHFMPVEIAGALKEKGQIRSKLVTVVTDFDVHRIWLNPCTDLYAVATSWTKERLSRLGVEENKIIVTGIPTAQEFSIPRDITELKEKLGLTPDIFTVLIATGSFGIGPIEEIVQALEGFQPVVVCGHNQGLLERLRQKKYPWVKAMGLVDNMPELMAVSNAMVTKPGGLSISEALVSHLPLIFFNAIPGQETGNVRALSQYGIGFYPGSVAGIVAELKRLKSSQDTYRTVLIKTQQLARPNAVRDIISVIK